MRTPLLHSHPAGCSSLATCPWTARHPGCCTFRTTVMYLQLTTSRWTPWITSPSASRKGQWEHAPPRTSPSLSSA
eukprot:461434-Pelagomonas_calceolata.AAC.1